MPHPKRFLIHLSVSLLPSAYLLARYRALSGREGHLARQRFGSTLRRIAALPLPNGWQTGKDSELSAQRPSRAEECQRRDRVEVRNRSSQSAELPNERVCHLTSGQGDLRLTGEGWLPYGSVQR